MAQIVPGILTNDEADYKARLEKAQNVASFVQVDVIDGIFAPNITIGTDVIKKYVSKADLEVQLMVHDPDKYIAELTKINYVSRIIFPFETNQSIDDNITSAKSSGKQASLSINPETPVSAISSYVDKLDMLCIFSASPGFSGKKLEEAVYGRIRESKKLFPDLPVEIDIGVNFETASKLVSAGADFLVATSTLHNSENFAEAYRKLAKIAETRR